MEPSIKNEFNKERLVAYCKKYNPAKVESVEEMFKKFAGKDEELFHKLEATYGENFSKLEAKYGENLSTVWLTEFYKKHNPSKIDSVADMLDKYAGREEKLYAKLKAKYYGTEEEKEMEPEEEKKIEPPIGSIKNEFNKERLVAYCKKYNPAKVESVEEMFKKYEGKDEELFF